MKNKPLLFMAGPLLFSFEVSAASADCKVLAKLIGEKVLEPNRGLHKDAERGSADPYWNRLSAALRAVEKTHLEKIFTAPNGMKLRDYYDALFWGVKSGEIKSDSRLDRMVVELRDFVNEYAHRFEDKADDKAFHILQALTEADQAHSFSGDPAAAAKLTIKALQTGEEALMARALAESLRGKKFDNSKWYDGVYRFFSPHYDRVQLIVAFLNDYRSRIQIDQIADRPVTHALESYTGRLNEREQSALRDLIVDTPGKLAEVRKRSKKFFGRELSITEPATEGDYRLQEIQKLIENEKKVDPGHDKAVRNAENDLDKIDEAIRAARERANEGIRPWDEYHDDHLRIRQSQYERETGELRSRYYTVTERNPERPDYDVEASRRVTETWTTVEIESYYDSQSKTTKTRPVVKTHTDSWTQTIDAVVKARYEEVLEGKMSPRDSETENQFPSARNRHGGTLSYGSASINRISSGRAATILKRGEQARALEAPFRKEINDTIDQLEDMRKRYSRAVKDDERYRAFLAEFDSLRKKIEASREQHLFSYQNWGQQQIKEQWSDDKVKDFGDRNRLLHERFRHMVNLIDHFREQARRKQNPIVIEYELADYSKQLEQLKKIKTRNRIIQGVGGTVIGVGAGYYFYNQAQEDNDDLEPYPLREFGVY